MISIRSMVAAACLLTFATAAQAGDAPSAAATGSKIASVFRTIGHCRVLDHSSQRDIDEHGSDAEFSYQRCGGYGAHKVWLMYTEGGFYTRIGFGARPNVLGPYPTLGMGPAPLEWRGVWVGGAFRPFAVILRVRDPAFEDKRVSILMVFRLRPDGTSCVVGDSSKTNADARRVADASRGAFTCKVEPDLCPPSAMCQAQSPQGPSANPHGLAVPPIRRAL
jgi:hypothetical protein